MLTYVSAKAGLIATKTAHGFDLEEIESGELSRVGPRNIAYHFSGCDDVSVSENGSIAEIRISARIAWAADRALALILFMFDPSELDDDFEELAQQAESFFEIGDKVRADVEARLYSSDLPIPIPFDELMLRLQKYPKTRSTIEQFIALQPDISHVRQAFDLVPQAMFAEDDRQAFFKSAIQRGAFRDLVLNSQQDKGVDGAIFDLLKKLSDQPNHREIISAWTETFKRTPRIHREWSLFREAPRRAPVPDYRRDGGHRAFERAMNQQKAIVAKLKSGDLDNARAFAQDLVAQQKRESEPEHVAKSLTSLSKEARDVRAFGLSIEWAYQATQIKPDDARTHSQLARSLIDAKRFTEALDELAIAETYGEAAFAATMRAGILRLQHCYEEALAAYSAALMGSVGTEEEPYNRAGVAEVLRDLGRLEDALDAYREAIHHFPTNVALLNGYAATLAEVGKIDEAFETYELSLRYGRDVVTYNGIATLLKQVGEFAESEANFAEIVKQYPYDIYARMGLADAMFANGKVAAALALAEETRTRFWQDSDAHQSMGRLLRNGGKVADAIKIYEAGIDEAGPTASLYAAIASAERSRGAYEKALRTLDAGAARFPNDRYLELARAGMLRRLGRLDEATELYDRVLSKNPSLGVARNSKASILIYQGRFSEARALLDGHEARTRSDWRAVLVLSHLELRLGDVGSAEKRLSEAYDQVPFERERQMVGAALASIRIEQERFVEALNVVDTQVFDIAQVVKLHALVASGFEERARKLLFAINDNAPNFHYQYIVNEIAQLGGILPGKATHDKAWIVSAERNALLLEAA